MKFKEVSESNDLSKDFLRLKGEPGQDTAIGVCAGELYEFRAHWNGKHDELCTGAKCERCKNNEKPRFRFRVNFIIKDESKNYVAKILELGWTVYSALSELNKEYDIEKYLIKITRKGKGANDTEYFVTPVKDGELNKEKLAIIAKIPLIDLTLADQKKDDAPAVDYGQETKFDASEEIPF